MSLVRPRTQAYLWQVSVGELTAKDKEWLDKAVQRDYHKISVDKILNDAKRGFCQLWRVGAEEGIIVTEVVLYCGESYLCANNLAARGFFENLDKVEECLVRYAKSMGCRGVQLETSRPGLQKLYEKRYKEITRVYIREIV